MKLFGALLLLAALLGPVSAHGPRREWTMPPSPPGVHGHAVPYTCGGKPYTGYVALPWRRVQGTPGVLVGHTWDGLGPMERYRTEQLAGRGYVAFALDVYGTGIRPTNDTAARAAMDRVTSNLTEYNQRSPPEAPCTGPCMTHPVHCTFSRLDCGFAQLTAAADFLNKSALFFNGYCFGGAMALHVARRGDPRLVGVSSFHGELGNLTSQSLDKACCSRTARSSYGGETR